MASAPVPPSFTNRATKLCAGCDNVKYCSVECQQAGWSHHKALCNTFKGFAETPSSGAQMRRFVAFILGEQKPRFMWAPVKDCMEYKSIEASGLAEVKHHLSQIPIQRNSWTEEPLGCAIMILHDDSFLAHYSDTNMAIVNATRGMSKYEWRGPLFAFCGHFSLPGEKGPVYGQECHRLDLPELYDMDMRSYAHLVAYLSDYSTKGAEGARYKGAKDDCVKVACKGDRLNGHPSHQVVCVPRTHPIFTGSGTASQISERLDIPLLTWRYPSSQESTENPHFNFMHVSCDPKAASEDYEISRDNSPFGWAPMRYQNNVDSGAIGDFCQWHLTAYFQDYGEKAGEDESNGTELRKKVLAQITKAKWSEYLSQWQTEKEDTTVAEARGESSYTVEKANSGLERIGLTEKDEWRLEELLSKVTM